ncbi:MAG: glutathione S-transferase N-terminal domain-containing protein, partial [Caldilineaceae bacterium]|nr:glutathione S-transferase N-terminal domain-containing protein [Caldilineaceae bacterium]
MRDPGRAQCSRLIAQRYRERVTVRRVEKEKTMFELYHVAGSSNSQRVRIVLAEKEIPWESHQLTLAGDLHTAAFRAISPPGTV